MEAKVLDAVNDLFDRYNMGMLMPTEFIFQLYSLKDNILASGGVFEARGESIVVIVLCTQWTTKIEINHTRTKL